MEQLLITASNYLHSASSHIHYVCFFLNNQQIYLSSTPRHLLVNGKATYAFCFPVVLIKVNL